LPTRPVCSGRYRFDPTTAGCRRNDQHGLTFLKTERAIPREGRLLLRALHWRLRREGARLALLSIVIAGCLLVLYPFLSAILLAIGAALLGFLAVLTNDPSRRSQLLPTLSETDASSALRLLASAKKAAAATTAASTSSHPAPSNMWPAAAS
jgi:hypothetical protein